jgi:hypothetical protein
LRVCLSDLSETAILLRRALEAGMDQILAAILRKLPPGVQMMRNFEREMFFEVFVGAVLRMGNGTALRAAVYLVDVWSRVAFVNDFLALIPLLIGRVMENCDYSLAALSAIASLCQHEKAIEELKKTEFVREIPALRAVEAYRPYLAALEGKI